MSYVRHVVGPWSRYEWILSLMFFYKYLYADIINVGLTFSYFSREMPKIKPLFVSPKSFEGTLYFWGLGASVWTIICVPNL